MALTCYSSWSVSPNFALDVYVLCAVITNWTHCRRIIVWWVQKWASAFRCKQNLFSFWPEKQNKNENCFCQTFRGKGLIFAGVNESLPHSHLENTRVVFCHFICTWTNCTFTCAVYGRNTRMKFLLQDDLALRNVWLLVNDHNLCYLFIW